MKDLLLAFIVASVVAGLYVLLSYRENTPTALDVYCGKTTLEIIYRDSVAIDSVVVYKIK